MLRKLHDMGSSNAKQKLDEKDMKREGKMGRMGQWEQERRNVLH